MNHRILAAIHAQPWAIMPGYLEAIEALAMRAFDHPAVSDVAGDGHADRHFEAIAQMGERVAGTRSAAIRDGVGALPMFGPILPRAAMVNPSGAGAVALDHLAADLRVLQADQAVKRILLTVDSPGGAVTGVAEFGRLVAKSQKPIVAHITGMCCSAAYWIASQATEISADAIGMAGSIGVIMGGSVQEGLDAGGRREVSVVSSGAPNKRPDLTSEDGIASVREMIDAIEDVFIQDVARGRGTTEAKVRAEFGKGGTKTGKHAKEAGMIDRIEADGLDGAIRRLSSRAPATPRRTAAANTLALAHLRAGPLTQGTIMRITVLNASLAAILLAMDGLLQVAADDSNRDLTAEEQTTFDAKQKEAEGLQASIKREEGLLALQASAAMPINLPGATGGQPGTVPAAVAEKPEPGAMVGRVAIAIAATGGQDQRAMAAHAQGIWGDQTGQIVANMEQSTATKGGYLVDTAYSRDFIGLLRPRVVIRNAGARSVPMPDGNITMRKQTGSTNAGYVGERTPAPVTDLSVGTLSMSAKTLRALVPITNQLIRRASFGVDSMVRDDLITSAAIKEDQQFLRGAGSSVAPTGLRNLIVAGNVLTMTANPTLITVTSDMARLKLKVVNANVPLSKCAYIVSPTVQSFLENIRDGNGNKAFPEVAEGKFGIYPLFVTTSVPDNLGAGSNESEVYFGDFEQFLIGDTFQVTLAASDSAAYDDNGTMRSAFSNDETVIRLIEEHDTQLRYDAAFAVLTGVTWKP